MSQGDSQNRLRITIKGNPINKERVLGREVASAAEEATLKIREKLDTFFESAEGVKTKNEVADLVSRARRHVKNLGAPALGNVAVIRVENAVDEFKQITEISRVLGEKCAPLLEEPLQRIYNKHIATASEGSPEADATQSHARLITDQMKTVLINEIDSRLFAGTGTSGLDQFERELEAEMEKVSGPSSASNGNDGTSNRLN